MTANHSVIDRRRGVVGIYPSREHANRAKSRCSGADPDREYRVEPITSTHERRVATADARLPG
jgi:hypothetical protein